MLKVNAFVEFDATKDRYVVTCVNVDTLEEAEFHVNSIEAQDQKIYDDPESYAAMKGIRLFTEAHEGLNGKAN
jgi:hypothetical protein